MFSILCYGDSNTWGRNPSDRERHPRRATWPYVMGAALGPDFDVIAEGLCGRTALLDDPLKPHRNGLASLTPQMLPHAPLDLVIIMLGTNSCRRLYNLSAYDIALGVHAMGQIVLQSDLGRGGTAPKLLLVAPPPIAHESGFGESFLYGRQKSVDLPKHLRTAAYELGCPFFNAADAAHASEADGVHLEADQHRSLGRAMAEEVRKIFV